MTYSHADAKRVSQLRTPVPAIRQSQSEPCTTNVTIHIDSRAHRICLNSFDIYFRRPPYSNLCWVTDSTRVSACVCSPVSYLCSFLSSSEQHGTPYRDSQRRRVRVYSKGEVHLMCQARTVESNFCEQNPRLLFFSMLRSK